MRHLKYEDEKVVAIESYIKDLQRDIDDLEWDGEQYKADKLKILLKMMRVDYLFLLVEKLKK